MMKFVPGTDEPAHQWRIIGYCGNSNCAKPVLAAKDHLVKTGRSSGVWHPECWTDAKGKPLIVIPA